MPKDSRRSSRQADFDDEIAGTSQSGTGGRMLHLTEDLIPKFTGQDKTYPAVRWVQDVEDNAELCGWTQLQQLLMARRSLAGTALLWLRAERILKTWEEFKNAIVKEFPETIDAKTIHEMMSSRHKQPNESCLDYVLVMKELGKRGRLPDYVAIKYIVEGIKDNEVNKIMLYGVTSYIELKEKVKIYEQLRSNIHKSQTREEENKVKHGDKTNRRFSRCFNCGEENHASADCPHKTKGLKCFRCNEFGHIAPNCNSSLTSRGRSDGNEAAGGTGGNIARKNPNETGGASFAPKRSLFGSSHSPANGDVIGGSDHISHQCLTSVITSEPADDTGKNGQNIQVKKPIKQVKVYGKTLLTLIDSGSDLNLISQDCYQKLAAPELEKCEITLLGLGAYEVKCCGRLKLRLQIDELWYDDVVFYVISGREIPYSMILGQEFLQHCVMLMENNNVALKPARDTAPQELKDSDQQTYIEKIGKLEEQKTILLKEIEELKEKQKTMCTKSRTRKKIKIKGAHELKKQEHKECHCLPGKVCSKNMKTEILTRRELSRNFNNKKSSISNECETGAITETQFGVNMKLKPKYLDPYKDVKIDGEDFAEGSKKPPPDHDSLIELSPV